MQELISTERVKNSNNFQKVKLFRPIIRLVSDLDRVIIQVHPTLLRCLY
jgi:hypothetical protein